MWLWGEVRVAFLIMFLTRHQRDFRTAARGNGIRILALGGSEGRLLVSSFLTWRLRCLHFRFFQGRSEIRGSWGRGTTPGITSCLNMSPFTFLSAGRKDGKRTGGCSEFLNWGCKVTKNKHCLPTGVDPPLCGQSQWPSMQSDSRDLAPLLPGCQKAYPEMGMKCWNFLKAWAEQSFIWSLLFSANFSMSCTLWKMLASL